MFYLALLCILFVCALHARNVRHIKGTHLTIVFCFFWLIAGLAWQTGVDWKVYTYTYEQCYNLFDAFEHRSFYKDTTSSEYGYAILSSVIKIFSSDYQVVHLIMSFISSYFFFKSLKEYRNLNIYLILLLYWGYIYLTLNMSGIRQAVSLSIFFYSLRYVKEEAPIKMLMCAILAILFHYSAIIIFPLYYILKKFPSSFLIISVLSIGFIIYCFQVPLISRMVEYISMYTGNVILYKVYYYVTNADEAGSGISLKIIISIILFIILYIRKERMQNVCADTNIFMHLYYIYLVANLYLWDTGDVIVRLQYYFVLGLILSFSIYMGSLTRNSNKITVICVCFILSFISSNPIFLNKYNALPYNPYQNYIIYQILGKSSSGEQRLEMWKRTL